VDNSQEDEDAKTLNDWSKRTIHTLMVGNMIGKCFILVVGCGIQKDVKVSFCLPAGLLGKKIGNTCYFFSCKCVLVVVAHSFSQQPRNNSCQHGD
jgi:hypothetical protein